MYSSFFESTEVMIFSEIFREDADHWQVVEVPTGSSFRREMVARQPERTEKGAEKGAGSREKGEGTGIVDRMS
jgi:hypothetical protein